jgi:hypothetical protein
MIGQTGKLEMKIPELMAYCGLRCDSCPIYLATREADPQEQAKKRIQIAELASEHYDMHLSPEDITDCDGCRTASGRLFSGCCKCEIRRCARQKGCPTCAHCTEYPCDILQKFFRTDPSAQRSLDDIRSHS